MGENFFNTQQFLILWGPGVLILVMLFLLIRTKINKDAELLSQQLEISRGFQERQVLALERQASALEKGTELAPLVTEMHRNQIDTGRTLRVISRKLHELTNDEQYRVATRS